MKNPVFYISFLINICFIINLGFSTNYYIDTLSGNDNNIGTSPGQAWETIDKVNSIVFQPGDSILFHRGHSWKGKISINYSGNSAQPIVFSSYGLGEYPIIKGSTKADSTSFWINSGSGIWESAIAFNQDISVLFYNTNDSLPLRANKESAFVDLDTLWDFYYDTISHKLIVYSPSDNPAIIANGIEITEHDYGIHIGDNCSNITISKLKFVFYTNDAIYAHIPDAGLKIDNNIIANIGGPGSAIFHGNGIFVHFLYPNDTITIINNKIYNIWHIGIFVPVGSPPSTLYGSQICNNELIMIGGSAIGVSYAIGIEVSNNYIHKASVYIPDRCGIGLENCDYIIVNNNIIIEAEDDGSSPYSGWLSAGIYTFGANHSKFYYNIVSDGMVGIHLDNDDGTYGYSSIGNEVCYNLCYNHYGIGIMIEQENDSTLVYNNTVYNCLHAGISFRGYWAGNSDHCSVKNNIVCNPVNSNNVIEIADIGTDFQMDYNCFYHSIPSANLVHWLGNNYTTAEFSFYQGFSNQDSNSFTLNPFFINSTNYPFDFSLNSYSACIDTGVYLGLNMDITGQPVPFNAIVDIGAYEYNNTVNNIIPIQNKETLMFQVFPNPTTGKTTIMVEEAEIIEVMNIEGKQIYTGKENQIDLSSQPKGIYIIKVTTQKGVAVEKIVLQ